MSNFPQNTEKLSGHCKLWTNGIFSGYHTLEPLVNVTDQRQTSFTRNSVQCKLQNIQEIEQYKYWSGKNKKEHQRHLNTPLPPKSCTYIVVHPILTTHALQLKLQCCLSFTYFCIKTAVKMPTKALLLLNIQVLCAVGEPFTRCTHYTVWINQNGHKWNTGNNKGLSCLSLCNSGATIYSAQATMRKVLDQKWVIFTFMRCNILQKWAVR